MHDKVTVGRGFSQPGQASIANAPAPASPIIAQATSIDTGLRELVSRLNRVAGLLVNRPTTGNVGGSDSAFADLSSTLASTGDALKTAHDLVSTIERDLAA